METIAQNTKDEFKIRQLTQKWQEIWTPKDKPFTGEGFEEIFPTGENEILVFDNFGTGVVVLHSLRAVTDRDVRSRAMQIAANGGKQRSKVWEFLPGCEIVYCEDPFGNIIEICSRSYERFWCNR